MPRPRRSKAAPASEQDDATDQSSQNDTVGAMSRAMRSIDALKKARAQNHAGIKEDYEAAVEMWKEQLHSHFAREAEEMDRRQTETINRLTLAVEKKISCEEAIAAKLKSLSDDQAHLAMLIDVVYTGRRDLARSVVSSLAPTSAAGRDDDGSAGRGESRRMAERMSIGGFGEGGKRKLP